MSVATINWNGVAGSTPDANSCMITYAAADTLYDTVNAQTFPAGAVSTALDTFLTNHGWSRVTATSGTISTTAGMYAYKAANLNDANGVGSYKYMLLDFRTSGKIYCKVYETIGTDSTLTNLAYQSDVAHGTVSAHTSGSTTYAGKLWIGATARHFVMQSYCNGVYGNQATTSNLLNAYSGPIACFELTRPNSVDIASSYPKFAFFTPDANGNYNASLGRPAFVLPRTRNGTGDNTKVILIMTLRSYSGWLATTYGNGSFYSMGSDAKPKASHYTVYDPVSPTANMGSPFNIIDITSNYGCHIGDDIVIPVSQDSRFSNEKFLDPDGTLTPYWLMGCINYNTFHRFAVPK